MGLRRLAAWVLVLLCAATIASAPAPAVLGGRVITIHSAPWAVFVLDNFGGDQIYNCSGSIIDSLHVLTAAHCLFNSSGFQIHPSQMTVTAGVANVMRPGESGKRQVRHVRGVRFLSSYRWIPGGEPTRQIGTDIAVLQLSTPFDLTSPDVRSVSLPTASMARPDGSGYVLNGFGARSASGYTYGILKQMTPSIYRFPGCSSTRVLCGSAPSSSSCPGDSGSGLVTPGPTPTLVGLLVTGSCTAGQLSSFVDLAASPIRSFVAGLGGSPTPFEPKATRWVPAGWLSQPAYASSGATLPLVVSLPRTWVTGALPDGTQNVWNPETSAEANVSTEGRYPTRSAFFASILASARASYLEQDGSAVVHSRIENLPGGAALEVAVHLVTRSSEGVDFLTIVNYNVFHHGVGYDVEYQGPPGDDAVDIPVWTASARTIHFTGAS